MRVCASIARARMNSFIYRNLVDRVVSPRVKNIALLCPHVLTCLIICLCLWICAFY